MKPNLYSGIFSFLLSVAAAVGQSGAAPTVAPVGGASAQEGQAVSYASVTQLNGMLSRLEDVSKRAQADLVNLRIERWKTDKSYKSQALGNVDSIQRNLQEALPEIIGQLRAAPEDLGATFKLYRNLDALYDVLGGVVEGVGAFGSKDNLQALSNDLNGFESTRKQLAERIENLSASKEAEITRLRTDLKAARAAAVKVEAPPKKVIVDDTQPAKKPVKKKTTTKKKSTTKPSAEQEDSSKPQ